MSRTDDYGLSDAGRERQDRSPGVQDRAEPSSRLGMSREAARVEMERFRGVAEYETRKIFGQRSALKQPVEVPAHQRTTVKRRKSTPIQRATARALQEPSAASSTTVDSPLRDDSSERPKSLNTHEEPRQ